MLKKLFKYDVLSILPIFAILAVSSVALSLLGSFALRYLTDIPRNAPIFFVVLCAVFFLVSVIAAGAFPVVTLILVYLRFYRTLYSDEGYLTFTLPVRRRTILLEKTLHAMLWTFIVGLITLVSVGFFLFIGARMPVPDIPAFFAIMWQSMGFWLVVYLPELLAVLLLGILFSVTMIHLAITIGAVVAKKRKLLAGIGMYFALNQGSNLVLSVLLSILFVTLTPGIVHYFPGDLAAMPAVVALFLLLLVAVAGVLATILYMLTLRTVERNLNLP